MIELSLTFQLPEDEIQTMIQHSIDLMVDESLDGKTWTIDEFRKNCCANKSAEWVRRFIFLKFSDEIDYCNRGWVINPKGGRGKKQIIFAKPACKWMEENRRRINWNAKI